MDKRFSKIKQLFAPIPEVDIHPSRGGKFRFPIYMTEALENTNIEALDLEVRAINCLKRAGIHTIGDLCGRIHCSSDLNSIRCCGKTSIAEIMDKLFAYQYSVLSPEHRYEFLAKVIEMNVRI